MEESESGGSEIGQRMEGRKEEGGRGPLLGRKFQWHCLILIAPLNHTSPNLISLTGPVDFFMVGKNTATSLLEAKCLHCVGTAWAQRAYCARRGWDTHPRIPVTCLLGGRLKGVNTIGLARCPSILLVVVITNSIVEEELSGPGVDSPPSSIGDREPSSNDAHVDFSAVVDVAIPIDDLEHLGSRITLKSTKVLVPHPKCLGSQKNPGTEPKTCEKGPKLGFEYLPTSKTSQCVHGIP